MPSISQPFAITTIPKQTTAAPIIVSTHNLTATTNTLSIAISKYAISKFVINPTPKLVDSIAIPSNESITAFNNKVYGSSHSNNTFFLHLNKDTKISIPCAVVNCVSNDSGETIVVLENGTIQKYKDITMVKSHVIPHKDIVKAEFISEKYLLIITKDGTSLYELSHFTELRSSTTLTASNEDVEIKQYKDKIYKYDSKSFKFDVYELSSLTEIHSIKLSFLDDKVQNSTFVVVADNRIVLSSDNTIYLLDIFLGSIIEQTTFDNLKWFKLLNAVEDGSFVLGISCKNSNAMSLNMINLELGSCTLKDSLGKSFQNFVAQEEKPLVLKSLFGADNNSNENDSEEEIEFDYNSIYNELKKNVKNVSKFDSIFFDKFNIKEEYYTENDRFITNQDFLGRILDLIFERYTFEESTSYPRTLTFLLTHPLLPANKTNDLLNKFKLIPRLYKQAIVTCPNLPLSELLQELFTIKNNELSLDISLRILQDFTKDLIKDELKDLPKIDIKNFIEFILESEKDEENDKTVINSQLFQLLSLVIDSIGLFALDASLLQKISDYVDRKVKIAERSTELWYLLDAKDNSSSSRNSKFVASNKSNRKVIPAYTVEYLAL